MQANTEALTNQVQALPVDWEETRCWAKTRLRSAAAVVGGFAAFLGLLGLVEYALYRMVENWSVGGLGASSIGFF
jgi:hypothetical protein